MRPSHVTLLSVLLVAIPACGGGPEPKDGSFARDSGAKHPLLGKQAPSIENPEVGGGGTVTTKHPGDVVILDFWATYCGPCVKEFPRLQALQDKYNGKVHVIAISEDEDESAVPPFLHRTGVKFQVTWDKDKAIGGQYSVDSMPQTFVLDGEGVVRFVHRGYRTGESEELEAQVKKLLAEK